MGHMSQNIRKAVGLLILLLCVLAGGVTGFVVYHRYRIPPSPWEENKAFFEKHNEPIGVAEKDIENAIEAYKGEHGSLPLSLDDLHLTNLPSGVSTSYLASFRYNDIGGATYELDVRDGGGIGVQLASRGDFRRIETVMPNWPASKANVTAGDYVLQVNGNDVTHFSHQDLLSVIRGTPGASVTLTLRKKDSGKTETVTLTREPFYAPVKVWLH
jgi:predicted metalloprotease with PDZ domain